MKMTSIVKKSVNAVGNDLFLCSFLVHAGGHFHW